MAQTFPWPVTDEELVLTNALENVMASYSEAGPLEEAWIREAAANLILDAHDHGVRDEDVLAHYALKTLGGRPQS
jgi:hypothetical protein